MAVHLHKQSLPSLILKANLRVLHLPLKLRTGCFSQSAASNQIADILTKFSFSKLVSITSGIQLNMNSKCYSHG